MTSRSWMSIFPMGISYSKLKINRTEKVKRHLIWRRWQKHWNIKWFSWVQKTHGSCIWTKRMRKRNLTVRSSTDWASKQSSTITYKTMSETSWASSKAHVIPSPANVSSSRRSSGIRVRISALSRTRLVKPYTVPTRKLKTRYNSKESRNLYK